MHASYTPIFRKALHPWSAGLLIFCFMLAGLNRTGYAQQTSSVPMSIADRNALRGALDAYDQGQAAKAEPVLRDLASRYPNSYEANEALGGIYAESNDTARALPYLQRACTIAPRKALAHANLGAAYLKLDRSADAVRELERASVLEPRNGATQSNLGQALMLTAQPAKAVKAFRIAVEAQPKDWDLRYNLALALYESGNAQQAAAALTQIPEAAMTDETHLLAGDVNEKLGDFKAAVLHYQAAAQANPSDTNLYTLTVEFLRHWTWDEAIKIADYGTKLYPTSTHFRAAEGIALYGNNKYPEAAEVFASLLAKDPENAMYADLLGRNCSLIVEGASACNGLQEFADKHPENARVAMYVATAMLHRPTVEQDTGRIEKLLRQAITADPKLTEAYYQLGVLEQQRLRWKESAVALEKAVELRPSYAEAHYRLSRAYSHLGMRDDAQEQIALQQQYVQQEKDNLNARMQEVMTFLVKPN
jgi:tetratricopeptide (TPR) repeat protein